MIAFKTWNQAPSNPLSVPTEWPWIQEVINESQIVAKLEEGFQVLSESAFAAYVDAHDEAFAAWAAANPNQNDFFINSMILTDEQAAQLAADDRARKFSSNLTAVLKILNKAGGMNLSQSVWAHHRLRALQISVTEELAAALPVYAPLIGETVTIDVMNLVISGDVETAYFVFAAATPDDGSKSYHAVTSQFLGFMKHQVGVFLGWES